MLRSIRKQHSFNISRGSQKDNFTEYATFCFDSIITYLQYRLKDKWLEACAAAKLEEPRKAKREIKSRSTNQSKSKLNFTSCNLTNAHVRRRRVCHQTLIWYHISGASAA